MNNKACLFYIVSDSNSGQKTNNFSPITENDRNQLFTNLFNNAAEQIGKVEAARKFVLTPERSYSEIVEHLSYPFEIIDYSSEENIYEKLLDINSEECRRVLLLFPDTIGFSAEDINRAFDLLSDEGNCLVIGKTIDNRICYLGTNFLDDQLFEYFSGANFNFDEFLKSVQTNNVYYFIFNNLLKIESTNDFKDLYVLLSNKESENFCSEEIHENFTNLFIEYKALLK